MKERQITEGSDYASVVTSSLIESNRLLFHLMPLFPPSSPPSLRKTTPLMSRRSPNLPRSMAGMCPSPLSNARSSPDPSWRPASLQAGPAPTSRTARLSSPATVRKSRLEFCSEILLGNFAREFCRGFMFNFILEFMLRVAISCKQ